MEKTHLAKRGFSSSESENSEHIARLALEAGGQDLAAYTELYRLYVIRIYRFLYSRLEDQTEAEEVTSQVFMAAWEALPRYKEKGSFTSWLFRIARNKLNDHFRRYRPNLPLQEVTEKLSENWDPLASLVQEEYLRQLAQIVQNLPREQYELLSMRFAAGLTYKEMASILGRSEGAVKMAFSRLVKKLKEEWEQDDD
jgi:RNA polymerase sigma-70 factor, ECF subfamily